MSDSELESLQGSDLLDEWDAMYLLRMKNRYKILQVYAPRNPPWVRYGIPLCDGSPLRAYAERNSRDPGMLYHEVDYLSGKVEYDLELREPYAPTADCLFILELYSNYSMVKKKLVDEDEEDVISMVKEILNLDPTLRPKWYYDAEDPWRPSPKERARLSAWLNEAPDSN